MKKESEIEEQKTDESKQTEPTEEAAEEIEKAEEAPKKEEEVEEAGEEKVEVEEELPPVEEVKPPPRKEVEEEIVEERIYTIPLGKAWIATPKKRVPSAVRIIKDFVKRHMKLKAQKELEEEEEEEEPKRLIISNEVNERVWRRGIEKPPRKVRVRAAKDKDGNVTVYLAEGD